MSNFLPLLQQHARGPNRNILCSYGDLDYLREQPQSPSIGAQITEQQNLWNKAMSKVRISVEWVFGDIVSYFKFLDFHKNLKVQVRAVGKLYTVCILLQNSRS